MTRPGFDSDAEAFMSVRDSDERSAGESLRAPVTRTHGLSAGTRGALGQGVTLRAADGVITLIRVP